MIGSEGLRRRRHSSVKAIWRISLWIREMCLGRFQIPDKWNVYEKVAVGGDDGTYGVPLGVFRWSMDHIGHRRQGQ